MYLLLIDEATRYKIVAALLAKDARAIGKVILHNWLKYFGPMKILKSDQEGGVKSEVFADICDRFSVHRLLAGSDAKGEHTSTGLVEKHI